MANQEHLDILAKGVETWNAWRDGHPEVWPDLRSTDLTRANLRAVDLTCTDLTRGNLYRADLTGAILCRSILRGATLTRADLTHANATSANMAEADLRGANLTGTDLSDANLYGIDLTGAILSRAILTGAILHGADLTRANLTEADLADAEFAFTTFGNVDLSTAKGLDKVRQAAPSTIGIDTVYRSGGDIPDSFLRGSGVPESLITYMRSLNGAAFDFYSCFISYSTKDQEFADRLYADLQARGVRCWFAPHDIQGGRKIHEQIDEAIKLYDKLLLILSDASMASNWVKTEITNARAQEQQQIRQMLFPITLVAYDRIKAWKLFDADTGIDSAREIREYFVPDFSNWKDHDSYAKAFDRLVRSLKALPDDKAGAKPAP